MRKVATACLALGVLTVPACSEGQAPVEVVGEPDPELVFVSGYRSASDPCQLTGESAFTIDFLDDAANLVSCPTGSESAATLVSETGALTVTQTQSFTLYSVPRR